LDKAVDRGGKVIVVISLFLTYLQFRYEVGLRQQNLVVKSHAETMAQNKGLPAHEIASLLRDVDTSLNVRYETVRHRVLVNALFMAGIGEVISGFGGTLVLPFMERLGLG
jgi:hypothetical protein